MAPKKKDISEMNTGRIYNTIANATTDAKARPEYTEEEAQAFKQQMKTSGRKGVKMPRINFAFTPDNYEYVQTMARVRGESMSDFLNLAIAEHMRNHRDLYERALEFKRALQ